MYKQYKFDLARNSLRYLTKTCNIKELYLPYYLCDVIRHAVFLENCHPNFYHIDDNFYPAQEFREKDYILYPNYFGICNKNVTLLEKIYPNLIVDNAHAFYMPPQGFACFNSERKFRNVENGSYLWIKTEGESADFLPIRPHKDLLKRLKNFIMLHEKFKNTNQLKIDTDSVTSPFCYPYLAQTEKEADKLANDLTKNGLNIYRYWNNLPRNYNEYKFYRCLVPIPIQ